MKTFAEYEQKVLETASYPSVNEKGLLYPALGLAGEAGEVVDKIKKYWRNCSATTGDQLTVDQVLALELELGDTMWYLSRITQAIGSSMDRVAARNIAKLMDRRSRGVIKSEGDNR